MNILVCGSEGSLMQATIPYLLKMGHSVSGVDSFFRYGKLDRKRDYDFIEGDLCDIDLASKVCNDIDVVFQAAARIFGVVGFHKYGADILAKDTALHQNILWEALNSNVQKVVYISSSMVYERATKVPSEEDDVDDMPIPLTDYGLSKLVGERLCKAFYQQYGLKYTIWRPFNIITPYEKGEVEAGMSHVFADFIWKIVIERQNPVQILGDGEQVRCFTWIEDVASAIAKYSLESVTDGKAFNLGNPNPITMKELASKIYNVAKSKGFITGKAELAFEYLPIFEDDVRVRIPSIQKAKAMLGWEPQVHLEEALQRCIQQSGTNLESC
ncbi:NAD-dependent epimerase/dehydratase family protein [Chloroflexota bacterium]